MSFGHSGLSFVFGKGRNNFWNWGKMIALFQNILYICGWNNNVKEND